MNRTIITSIITTLLTLAVVAQPWLIYPLIWLGVGRLALYLAEKYLYSEEEKTPPLYQFLFAVLGLASPIVILIIAWRDIKEKYKFQSPIVKNE